MITTQWLRNNFAWIKWIVLLVWSAIMFFGGNYISYREMQIKVENLEKFYEDVNKKLDIIISKL